MTKRWGKNAVPALAAAVLLPMLVIADEAVNSVSTLDPAEGCARQAAAWWNGRPGIPFRDIDSDKATPLCQQAVSARPDDGDLWAYLARALSRDGMDESATLSAIKKAVELDSLAGNWYMGVAYDFGYGIDALPFDELGDDDDVNMGKAVNWYRQAADAGYPPAQLRLGRIYMQGYTGVIDDKYVDVVEKDETEGERLLQQAAAAGSSAAFFDLRDIYLQRWEFASALEYSESAVRAARLAYGDSHPTTAADIEDHGNFLLGDLFRPVEAKAAYIHAAGLYEQIKPGGSDHLRLLVRASDAAHAAGDHEEALRLARAALMANTGKRASFAWYEGSRTYVSITNRINALLLHSNSRPRLATKGRIYQGPDKAPISLFEDPPFELFSAIKSGDIEAITVELEKGSSPNHGDADGRTAFHYLAENRDSPVEKIFAITRLLLEHGADPTRVDADEDSPIYEATRNNNAAACAAVAAAILAVDFSDEEPEYMVQALDRALRRNKYQCADALLAQGVRLEDALEENKLARTLRILDDEAIYLLLVHGLNANVRSDSRSELRLAAEESKFGRFHALVYRGAEPTAALVEHLNLLGFGNRTGNIHVVRALLETGADPNGTGPEGRPLNEAVDAGQLPIIEILLEVGADPNLLDDGDDTPLQTITSHSELSYEASTAIVDLLIQSGADPNASASPSKRKPIIYAARSANAATVGLLLSAGADPNVIAFNGCTPLMETIDGPSDYVWDESKGNFDWVRKGTVDARIETIETLLEGGADAHMTTRCGNAYSLAKTVDEELGVSADDLPGPILQALTKMGVACPCDICSSAPQQIEQIGEWSIAEVDQWLESNGNPNACDQDGLTAVYYAFRAGATETLHLLLKAGGNVNSAAKKGRTLLHEAARSGDSSSILVLLNFGADVDRQDEDRRTALFDAVDSGQKATVRLLLENGADVDAVADTGVPLAAAARAGWLDGILLLLEFGADPNGADTGTEAMRPIDVAASEKCVGCVDALLNAGAEATARDSDKWSASQYATYCDEPISETQVEALLDLLLLASPDEDLDILLGNSVASGCLIGVSVLLKKRPTAAPLDDRLLHEAIANHPNWLGKDLGPEDPIAESDEQSAVAREMVQLLLEHGANPNAVDEYGNSVLTQSAQTQDLKLISLVADAGADPRLTNAEGEDTWGQLQTEPDARAQLAEIVLNETGSSNTCLGIELGVSPVKPNSTPKLISSFSGGITDPDIAIKHEGRVAMISEFDGVTQIWDLETIRLVAEIGGQTNYADDLSPTNYAADLSTTDAIVAVPTELGLKLFNLANHGEVIELDPSDSGLAPPWGESWRGGGMDNNNEVTSVWLSPNAARAALERLGVLEIWNIASCERVGTWDPAGVPTAVSWKSDGSGVYAGWLADDQTYLVELEIDNGFQEVNRWSLPEPECIFDIAVSSPGDRLLIQTDSNCRTDWDDVENDDNKIIEFDAQKWQVVQQWKLPVEAIGEIVASGETSWDPTSTLAPFFSSDGTPMIAFYEGLGCFTVLGLDGDIVKERRCGAALASRDSVTRSVSATKTGVVVTDDYGATYLDFNAGIVSRILGSDVVVSDSDTEIGQFGYVRTETSPDLTKVVGIDGDGLVHLWNVSAPNERVSLGGLAGCEPAFGDSGLIVGYCPNDEVRVFEVGSENVAELPTYPRSPADLRAYFGYVDEYCVERNAEIDGKRHRLTTCGETLITAKDGSELRLRAQPDAEIDSLDLWNIDEQQLVFSMPALESLGTPILSRDGSWVVSAAADGLVQLIDSSTGEHKVSVRLFSDGNWVIHSPSGHFDTSDFSLLSRLSWVLPQEPLRALPVESFLREYYEPGLFGKVLRGERLRQVALIADLNRTLPMAEIAQVAPDGDGTVAVRVRVKHGFRTSPNTADELQLLHTRGVQDLKLFRNGQLVGFESGQLLPAWPESGTEPKSASREIEFSGVKLPSDLEADSVEFTAYAFNEDGVKSITASAVYKLPSSLPSRPRRAYVVSIGMNAYENSSWDLTYAADDACAVQDELVARLKSSGEFSEVVGVPLISTKGGESTTSCRETGVPVLEKVTQEQVRAVFEALAGRSSEILSSIPNGDLLKEANPEDVLLITYAGHGLADSEGGFHLFPWNTGAGEARKVDEGFFSDRSISSDDLSLWLRDVDAGELTMIIDACQSASSVEGAGDFRPGPMGSRGLGQLAYDKGMRLLAASQAEAVALESDLLRHGMLTYALVREGLEANQADAEPEDGIIGIGEWLRFGVSRVPTLYEEIVTGQFAPRGDYQAMLRGGFKVSGQEDSSPAIPVQQPALFDFARSTTEEPLLRSH